MFPKGCQALLARPRCEGHEGGQRPVRHAFICFNMFLDDAECSLNHAECSLNDAKCSLNDAKLICLVFVFIR
jgi:hypothetical protein